MGHMTEVVFVKTETSQSDRGEEMVWNRNPIMSRLAFSET